MYFTMVSCVIYYIVNSLKVKIMLYVGVYFTMERCVFYYGVVCILLWHGVYFTMV